MSRREKLQQIVDILYGIDFSDVELGFGEKRDEFLVWRTKNEILLRLQWLNDIVED